MSEPLNLKCVINGIVYDTATSLLVHEDSGGYKEEVPKNLKSYSQLFRTCNGQLFFAFHRPVILNEKTGKKEIIDDMVVPCGINSAKAWLQKHCPSKLIECQEWFRQTV